MGGSPAGHHPAGHHHLFLLVKASPRKTSSLHERECPPSGRPSPSKWPTQQRTHSTFSSSTSPTWSSNRRNARTKRTQPCCVSSCQARSLLKVTSSFSLGNIPLDFLEEAKSTCSTCVVGGSSTTNMEYIGVQETQGNDQCSAHVPRGRLLLSNHLCERRWFSGGGRKPKVMQQPHATIATAFLKHQSYTRT